MCVHVKKRKTERRETESNFDSDSESACLSEHMCISMLFVCVWGGECVCLRLSVRSLVGVAWQGL